MVNIYLTEDGDEGILSAVEAFPLGDLLVAMTSGTGDCAVVHDVIPLMSIAGWSLLGFSLLLFASVMQLRQSLR